MTRQNENGGAAQAPPGRGPIVVPNQAQVQRWPAVLGTHWERQQPWSGYAGHLQAADLPGSSPKADWQRSAHRSPNKR